MCQVTVFQRLVLGSTWHVGSHRDRSRTLFRVESVFFRGDWTLDSLGGSPICKMALTLTTTKGLHLSQVSLSNVGQTITVRPRHGGGRRQ